MRATGKIIKNVIIIVICLNGLIKGSWFNTLDIRGQIDGSEKSRHIAFGSELDTTAILASLPENKQVYFNQRKISPGCYSVNTRTLERELTLSILIDGSLPFIFSSQLKSHSLFTIHCLLNI